MSIFSKPISRLGTEDLEELLKEAAVENVRLEFKLEVPGKDETLKKLSSFANTFGGFLVVGARASSADGRLQTLSGVELQDGYKQKVVQWSFDGASPPLNVEVSDPIPAPGAPDRFCYVIYTAESDLTPHFLNGRKGVYVRTDEFSARFEARLANENDVRHLLDRRKVVRERRAGLLARARKRFATFARRRYAELAAAGKTDRKEFGARLELCVCPRFPARPVCRQGDLAPLLRDNSVPWRQVGFPRLGNGIVSQHESAIILQGTQSFSIIEANIWGMLFYGTEIETETTTAPGVHLHGFIGSVLVFIRHAGRFLHALGYSGPVIVETALASVLGVDWLHFPHRNFASTLPGSELDDEVEFASATTSEALRESPDTVAMEVLREVFFSVNLPQLVDTPQKLENLVLKGYEYNCWRNSN
jgi:hypothetical protein